MKRIHLSILALLGIYATYTQAFNVTIINETNEPAIVLYTYREEFQSRKDLHQNSTTTIFNAERLANLIVLSQKDTSLKTPDLAQQAQFKSITNNNTDIDISIRNIPFLPPTKAASAAAAAAAALPEKAFAERITYEIKTKAPSLVSSSLAQDLPSPAPATQKISPLAISPLVQRIGPSIQPIAAARLALPAPMQVDQQSTIVRIKNDSDTPAFIIQAATEVVITGKHGERLPESFDPTRSMIFELVNITEGQKVHMIRPKSDSLEANIVFPLETPIYVATKAGIRDFKLIIPTSEMTPGYDLEITDGGFAFLSPAKPVLPGALVRR